MNPIINSIQNRKSVRVFEERDIPDSIKDIIIDSSFQAPTAGNQMLYSIIDVTDQSLKDKLAISCDDQPFIAKAPLVLIYLADCRRWFDSYVEAGLEPREPETGDILLAMQDAVIAAQNAVMAAESFGIGSCYIGDILENVEYHRELLKLDRYVVPICMLVFGYPTAQQRDRHKPKRFDREYIVFQNEYRRLGPKEHREMHVKRADDPNFDYNDFITKFCNRKYMSEFSKEMSRSARLYIKEFERN